MRRSTLLSCLAFSLGISKLLFATPQVLNIGNGSEPKDLDPHTVTGVPESQIIQNLFEGLVSKDPQTLKPVGGVAESWKVSKDGRTYIFKIRKNAKWSNGDPVTSQDFIFSWKRLLDPQTASEYAYQGYYIRGGRDFNLGKVKDSSQLGLKAPSPETLEVVLENPTPYFLSLLYHHSLYPVHQTTVQKHQMRWTRPENIVSNGPFTLQKWEMNKVISLQKSPHHWDAPQVKLEGVNYYPIEKPETEEKLFQVKKLHVTGTVPTEKIAYWTKDNSGVFRRHPYLGTYFYWMNVTRPPINNKLVRKALALAIDREKLVKFVVKGGQAPAEFFTPPGIGDFHPKALLPKDGSRIAEAKKLLEQAGFPQGKGLPSIEILYNTSDAHKKIAEAIQQMWKENLGVQATLYNQEWKVFLDTQHSHNYMVSRAGWIADYNDPNTFLDMLTTGNGNNHAAWSNTSYDELIAKAAKEKSPQKRNQLFQKAEEILLEELPVLPLYIYTRIYLLSTDVQGWYENVEDVHPLKYVSLK
ncbi:MAG: peptide ABC transporter substrate-binding protein [Proteobacteria bacterium]|nr:peptide ABC transporter substrate-binding protein [Pseudomonadota bacterium]NDC24083.1 peptide ABC transporter substrate-binding protein [Pseudomonadota bacterium]NDD04982.1 peptide ABC transporter substrate-binding protein [Pseudomonadota bacterium]NDG25962.1 peptide ABC transporter substrate-binding protein [Pseudomonadota bacterium]